MYVFVSKLMVFAAGAALCLLAGVSYASDRLPGPVAAQVVRVVDGDTILVKAHIWLGQEVETSVRLIGIDTPELKGRCEAERQKAEAARNFLATRLDGQSVQLFDVLTDKYGGRVLARVQDGQGGDIAEALIKAGFARRYDGGRRESWCAGGE